MKSMIVKTLALGAVCVMAAQGAWGAGTDTDENGNQPAMWYKFDGSVTNVGTVDPTSTGNTGGSYEDVGDKDGNQAYKIVTTSHNIYGQNMNNIRGSGDFTVMLRAKLSSLDNGVVWSMGTSGSGRFMALCEDGGNSVSLCLAGNSWSMADGYTTVNNTAVTKVITKTVENATLQYHVYTVSWDNTNKIWTLDVDGESSTYAGVQDNIGDFTNGNWQFGGVHGGMGSRGLTEGVGIVCDDFRVYQSAVSGDTLTTILNSNPVYPSLTVYTYDCDAETPAWSPALPDTITSLCVLEYTGTGTVAAPEGYASAAAITIGENVTITGVSTENALSIKGTGTVKLEGDDLTTLPLADSTYSFTSPTIEVAQNVTVDGQLMPVGNKNYKLNSDISAGYITLGNQAGVTQNYLQIGGTVSASSDNAGTTTAAALLLGHWSSTVNYTITDGTLSVENGVIRMGWDGSAKLNVNGGAVTTKGFRNAQDGHSGSGAIIIAGGTITVTDSGFVMGNGSLTLAGGTLMSTATEAKTWTIGGGVTIAESDYPTEVYCASDVDISGVTVTTDGGSIKKTGAGTLNLGSNRPVIDLAEGGIKMIATSAEIAAGKLVLSVPENATEASSATTTTVLDSEGNTVKILNTTVDNEQHTVTLTLDVNTAITETCKVSEKLTTATSGMVIIAGPTGDDDEPITVTFDIVPANATFTVTGKVKFEVDGSTVTVLPLSKINPESGAVITVSTAYTGDDFTVPNGVTLNLVGTSDEGDSTQFNVINNGTIKTTGNVTIANSLAGQDASAGQGNTGLIEVVSGMLTNNGANRTVGGTITIDEGAVYTTSIGDQFNYNGSVTINVYGTLALGTARQSFNANANVNLYGGTITGSNDSTGNVAFFYASNTLDASGVCSIDAITARDASHVVTIATADADTKVTIKKIGGSGKLAATGEGTVIIVVPAAYVGANYIPFSSISSSTTIMYVDESGNELESKNGLYRNVATTIYAGNNSLSSFYLDLNSGLPTDLMDGDTVCVVTNYISGSSVWNLRLAAANGHSVIDSLPGCNHKGDFTGKLTIEDDEAVMYVRDSGSMLYDITVDGSGILDVGADSGVTISNATISCAFRAHDNSVLLKGAVTVDGLLTNTGTIQLSDDALLKVAIEVDDTESSYGSIVDSKGNTLTPYKTDDSYYYFKRSRAFILRIH